MHENSDRGPFGGEPHRIDAPTTAEGRELVGRVLQGQPEPVVEFAKFSVTELVANAYVHGLGYTRDELAAAIEREELPSEVSLIVTLGQSEPSQKWYVILTVHDPNPDRPDWDRDPTDNMGATGRGLAVVRVFATGYGAVSCGTGKDVFAEFEIDPPPGS
ncbi:hypothetical protein E1281_19705 [Actinomadura sp. KC345]|uniref:hypothetical protein n=1 Tax=Actinomadura sp. KC345 TaxID=2530371 RepID=UPI001048027D|nr:hypothetical protein [Actinomadura sp. KC345]TDC51937.1 hypothetical protein E1281_19705 [Actinomadura sp. KC345]